MAYAVSIALFTSSNVDSLFRSASLMDVVAPSTAPSSLRTPEDVVRMRSPAPSPLFAAEESMASEFWSSDPVDDTSAW